MNVKITSSGTDIVTAKNKFIKSSHQAINNLKIHQGELNQIFQNNIHKHSTRAGINLDLSETFHVVISNGNISFIDTEPLITQRYEYGYYSLDENDIDDEYDYFITGPRYFIRPAINETLQTVGNFLLNDAKKSYNNTQTNERDNYYTQQ